MFNVWSLIVWYIAFFSKRRVRRGKREEGKKMKREAKREKNRPETVDIVFQQLITYVVFVSLI